MGIVFVAEHTLLGRKAAIKVRRPAYSSQTEVVQRFFNEARAVTQIVDPGIVQVFDFGYDDAGRAYIIMELLDGEPMNKRLERIGAFSQIETLLLMRQICNSLSAAHAKGIVHRDLKPDNLFIVGDPAVTGGERTKILDFGIAKLSGDEPGKLKTRTGAMLGTPVYMSPEQCRGAGDVDARSDIYSIGCVMMTMLTGRPPFEGSGTGDLIVAHMREPAPLASSRVPDLLPVLDQIVARCLAKDPNQRFRSMLELVDALADAERSVRDSGPVPTRASYQSGPDFEPTIPAPPMSQPTTLSSAASQTSVGMRSRRRGLIATTFAGVTGAVIAYAVVASHRGTRETHVEAPQTTAPVPIDAQLAAVVDSAPASVAIAIDAGAIAPAIAIDAGTPAVKPPKRTGGNNHARPSNDATSVDRGD